MPDKPKETVATTEQNVTEGALAQKPMRIASAYKIIDKDGNTIEMNMSGGGFVEEEKGFGYFTMGLEIKRPSRKEDDD